MARALIRRRGLRAALIVAALSTATLMLGSTAALAATNTATSGTTVAATTATDLPTCGTDACVPVFNTDGVEVAIAVVNSVTGQIDLVGPAGNIIGVVEQEGSALVVVGAGGAVVGTLAVNPATGQVIFAPV